MFVLSTFEDLTRRGIPGVLTVSASAFRLPIDFGTYVGDLVNHLRVTNVAQVLIVDLFSEEDDDPEFGVKAGEAIQSFLDGLALTDESFQLGQHKQLQNAICIDIKRTFSGQVSVTRV